MIMLKGIISATVAFFIAATAFATTFEADTKATKLKWNGEKVTGEHYGYVQLESGKLMMDGDELTGGEFTINMTTINVKDIEDPKYNKKLENHLKSDDFFSVQAHPRATFEVTDVAKKNGNKYEVTGNLTIKGITHPVTFPAEISMSGDKVKATADITVDRSKYNVKFRSKSFFDMDALGDKLIYDEFKIYLTMEADKSDA